MLYCMEDFLGGPKLLKVKTAVNLQVHSIDIVYSYTDRKEEPFSMCYC